MFCQKIKTIDWIWECNVYCVYAEFGYNVVATIFQIISKHKTHLPRTIDKQYCCWMWKLTVYPYFSIAPKITKTLEIKSISFRFLSNLIQNILIKWKKKKKCYKNTKRWSCSNNMSLLHWGLELPEHWGLCQFSLLYLDPNYKKHLSKQWLVYSIMCNYFSPENKFTSLVNE